MIRVSKGNLYHKALKIFDSYESITGLKVVREAQQSVIKAERDFIEIQERRRDLQVRTNAMDAELRQIGAELDKVSRGDDKFLQLVTEEHRIIREGQAVRDELAGMEKRERSAFTMLSTCLRDSHEKERIQTEKTKYWSLSLSLVGALIGIVATSVNNYRRTRDLRQALQAASHRGISQDDVDAALAAVVGKVDDCRESIRAVDDRLRAAAWLDKKEIDDVRGILEAARSQPARAPSDIVEPRAETGFFEKYKNHLLTMSFLAVSAAFVLNSK